MTMMANGSHATTNINAHAVATMPNALEQLDNAHVKRRPSQRDMKFGFNNHVRPRTASSNTTPGSSTPVSPTAPQLPPLPLSNGDDSIPYPMSQQRPYTSYSHHSSPNQTPPRSYSPSRQTSQHLPKHQSEASRLRALNNGYRSRSQEGRQTPDGQQHPPPVDNFSRPRQPSIRRRNDSPKPIHASTFPLQAHDEEQTPTNGSVARDRGLSTSSSHSTSSFPAKTIRPSMSIPDYNSPESIYSRQRNLTNPNYIAASRSATRPNSNYSSHRREPIPRPAGFESEEVRASFRSALTTNSSFLGTSGTERSSVMTKSSSATSIYGRDEGMSVDDAIGMYEGGFQDSGTEDNYGPRRSEEDRRRSILLGEAMNESLIAPSNSVVRDSAAIFTTDLVDTPVTQPSSGPDEIVELKESYFDGPISSTSRPGTRAATSPTKIASKDGTRDRYGFRKATQHVSLEAFEAWNGPYTEHLARRKKKWVALLKDKGLPTDNPQQFPPQSDKVKRFIRKGLPPEWRGAAWWYYAGGPTMVNNHRGVYDDLVRKAAAGQVTQTDDEIIERDLHRTFPDNIKFKPDPPPGQESQAITNIETPILQSLRRVLQAFSIYNPKIGYCQSLNFLAGLLLLFMDEEKSFWMLNIITRVYLPGTHELNLEGANVDLGVLMSSIKDMMPQIWSKIGGELDGSAGDGRVSMRLPPITLCTTAWFMSCFIGTLPIESVLRVWDSFFYEGSKTLFRIALTIFKVGEAEIKAVSDPMEIFQVVQTIPRRLVDANALIEACFKRRNGFGHLSQETIEKGRAARKKVYAEERARANGGVVPERKKTVFGRKKSRPGTGVAA